MASVKEVCNRNKMERGLYTNKSYNTMKDFIQYLEYPEDNPFVPLELPLEGVDVDLGFFNDPK